jgi:monoamine oxidase
VRDRVLSPSIDVAIVGAGAAGLAAARDLHARGLSVLVLEARRRIGGRVFTVHPRDAAVPIELGAEFVHGRADDVTRIARAADLRVLEIEGLRVESTRARLRRLDDFWQRLDTVMRRLPDARERDASFGAFLKNRPGGRSLSSNRQVARRFVEGFHAADVDRISAVGLRESGSPGDDEREQRLGRIAGGYDRVINWLAAPIRGRIRTNRRISLIDWRETNIVRLAAASGAAVHARAAVVTVPLGVLQSPPDAAGALRFDPPLGKAKQMALAGVAMGQVTRIVLLFREAVWSEEQLASRTGLPTDLLTFLHGASTDFPVWWTAYPSRVPVITGWCGGPRAATLSSLPFAELTRRAVRALAAQLHVGASRLEERLVHAWSHDWNRDPYARGAYSYQVVGGDGAVPALARPLAGRLFFAGEATDTEGATGTVHGAIASGRRAARQVNAALTRR